MRVGLLATEATVCLNAYQNALRTLDAGPAFAVARPRLLLIQATYLRGRRECGQRGASSLKAAGADTVTLADTLPSISPMLRRLLGLNVALNSPRRRREVEILPARRPATTTGGLIPFHHRKP
jgi:glutamate racemase